jgi:hypothetical protein
VPSVYYRALLYCRQCTVSVVEDTQFCIIKLTITTKISQYVPLQFRRMYSPWLFKVKQHMAVVFLQTRTSQAV